MSSLPKNDGAPPSASQCEPPAWQLSLRELFGWTTYCALAVALVKVWGHNPIMPTIGSAIVYLNFQGKLRAIQSGRGRTIAVWTGVVSFVASLFLPVLPEPIFGVQFQGWEAAWLMVTKLMPRRMRSETDTTIELYTCSLALAIQANVSNFVSPLVPLTLYFPWPRMRQWLGAAMYASLPITWVILWKDSSSMGIGYYAWIASMTLIANTFPMRRNSLAFFLAGAVWAFIGVLLT